MKLNDRHILFVNEWFINGMNALAAYQKIYPKANYNTCMGNGTKLLQDPNIQELIQQKQNELAKRNNITKDEIINVLVSIMYNQNARNGDRIKAASELNKMNGFNEIQTTNVNFTNNNLKDLLGFND